MPLCVTLDVQTGVLTPTGQTVDQCAGYVLVSGSEYGVYQAIQSALAAPDPEEVATVFATCFSLPLFFYMVGHIAGRLARFFS